MPGQACAANTLRSLPAGLGIGSVGVLHRVLEKFHQDSVFVLIAHAPCRRFWLPFFSSSVRPTTWFMEAISTEGRHVHIHPDRRGHSDGTGEPCRRELLTHIPRGRENEPCGIVTGVAAGGQFRRPEEDVRVATQSNKATPCPSFFYLEEGSRKICD
jgi:hypothetical protein